MVFREALQNLVEQVPGAMAAMIMGYDGIPLDQYARANGAVPFDLQTVAVEYCSVIGAIRKNAEQLGVEGVEEITIGTTPWTLLIRLVNQDYFAVMAMGPNGYFGKGRYLLRQVCSRVRSEL